MMRYLPSVWPLKSNGGCRLAQPREQLHGSIARMPTKPSRVHPRFLVPDLDPASGEARLPPDESRHLTRVLRLREGVTVSAFDGRGHEFLARVTNTRDTLVTIALIEAVEPAAGPVVPFVLVQSVIKGGGMDDDRPRRYDDGRDDHSAGGDRAHGGQASIREAWGER